MGRLLLSFYSPTKLTGGVWAQPVLGRAADAWGYAPSDPLSAGIAALAIPFIWRSRRERDPADTMVGTPAAGPSGVPSPSPR